MKTIPAIYRGDRAVELLEDITLPKDMEVLVVIPEQDNERTLLSQLQSAAETAFARLWDNEKDEIQETPEEYLLLLLEIVRLFRESVTLKPAEASFRRGWKEAMAGETRPVSELWESIHAE